MTYLPYFHNIFLNPASIKQLLPKLNVNIFSEVWAHPPKNDKIWVPPPPLPIMILELSLRGTIH